VVQYYGADPDAAGVDLDSINGRVSGKFTNPKHEARAQGILRDLPDVGNGANVLLDLALLRKSQLGDELALKLANKSTDGVAELMREYVDLDSSDGSQGSVLESKVEDGDLKNGLSAVDIVAKSFREDLLIPLSPKILNDSVGGGLRPGHHVLVYARPEMGKSLFSLNVVAGALGAGFKVLYIANEDPASDLLIRCIGRLAGMNRDEVLTFPKEATEEAVRKGYNNLFMYEASPGTFPQIRSLIYRTKPHLVIIDQIRNINMGEDNRVIALEKACMEARNIAKSEKVAVISVTQAGESAEGKMYLDMSDVDFSKTGMQATVDLQLGIGANRSNQELGVRGIHAPKNKLTGDHFKLQVMFDPKLGQVNVM
jgi:hypothetical protein